MTHGPATGRAFRGRGGARLGLALALVLAGALTWVLLRRPTGGEPPELSVPPDPEASAPVPAVAATEPAPAPPEDAAALGRRLFREACAWVAGGEPDIVAVADLALVLTPRAEASEASPGAVAPPPGSQRVWLRGREHARWDTDLGQGLTSRVLLRDGLHERAASGRFRNAKRDDDGAPRLARARADRQRLIDLAAFVTLAGLDLPDATFTFEGEKTHPESAGTDDGRTWAKVSRNRTGERGLTFWFATERRRDRALHVTYPGWVRVEGDLPEGLPAEDVLLEGWQSAPGRQRRLPTALRILEVGSGKPARVLLDAAVTEFRINAGIDPEVFSVH